VAVSTTYGITFAQYLDALTGPLVSAADVTGLSNGGYAVTGGISPLQHAFEAVDPNHVVTGSTNIIEGANPSIIELSGGNFIIPSVSESTHSLLWQFRLPNGNQISASSLSGDHMTVDAAALINGGAALVAQEGDGSGSFGLRLVMLNNAAQGVLFDHFVGNSSAVNTEPVVAALDDGGFAIAWTATVGGQSEIWYTIYNQNGSVRMAPAIADTAGSVNRDVSITSTAAGFALAYEDSAWNAANGNEITLMRFNFEGTQIGATRLTNNSTLDTDPSITRLSSGILAMAHSNSQVGLPDSETAVSLIDSATGLVLATHTVLGGEPVTDDNDDPTLAGIAGGRIVVFHTNSTDHDIDGEELQAYRTTIGDNAGNAIFGDILIDVVDGGGGADTIVGYGGNDRLSGGGGDDSLNGGLGNDVLEGGLNSDLLGGGDGDDNLFAMTELDPDGSVVGDSLVGDDGNDTLRGSSGADQMSGGDGDDTLNGGQNGDTMTGGLGNDTYYVDNIGDTTDETGGGGTGDYVFSTVSFTAAAGIERLYLTGSANINATGRAAQNDILVGNSGNNVINGLSGADVMRGGLGNDTYYVDSISDTTDEVTGGGGTGDYVFSSVSFTAASGIERLYLTGTGNINATGRALQNDILVGNSGNNIIDGLSGNDVMRGGLGNDTYYVDSTLDTTDEVTGGGGTLDVVYSSVTFTASQGVERLYLTGSSNINGTGRDAQNDILGGNSGNNALSGLTGNDTLIGGLGNDTLSGGAGLDIFRFDTALNAGTNMDTVTDFVAADDTIQLENAIFTALTVTGILAAGAFNTGTAATQADDRIIYNTVTGALLYDADGLGGTAGVQFALLSTHPAGVSAADFLVY
jgi:Ca2+-binding RTX toxin-like protein